MGIHDIENNRCVIMNVIKALSTAIQDEDWGLVRRALNALSNISGEVAKKTVKKKARVLSTNLFESMEIKLSEDKLSKKINDKVDRVDRSRPAYKEVVVLCSGCSSKHNVDPMFQKNYQCDHCITKASGR